MSKGSCGSAGDSVAQLAEKLTDVRGGRLLLALATGVVNLVPVIGSTAVEYKNLYAAAATNASVAALQVEVQTITKALEEHSGQLEQHYLMIEQVGNRLQEFLGEDALSKVQDLDQIADAFLRPNTLQQESPIVLDDLDSLLDEQKYEQLLNILDEIDLTSRRARLLRTKALTGMEAYTDLYILLRREDPNSLTQEELESFIWSCFHCGYMPDGVQSLRIHITNFRGLPAELFRKAVHSKFSGTSE